MSTKTRAPTSGSNSFNSLSWANRAAHRCRTDAKKSPANPLASARSYKVSSRRIASRRNARISSRKAATSPFAPLRMSLPREGLGQKLRACHACSRATGPTVPPLGAAPSISEVTFAEHDVCRIADPIRASRKANLKPDRYAFAPSKRCYPLYRRAVASSRADAPTRGGRTPKGSAAPRARGHQCAGVPISFLMHATIDAMLVCGSARSGNYIL